MDSELLHMAKRFSHSEDIARAPGNTGEYTLQESVEYTSINMPTSCQ